MLTDSRRNNYNNTTETSTRHGHSKVYDLVAWLPQAVIFLAQLIILEHYKGGDEKGTLHIHLPKRKSDLKHALSPIHEGRNLRQEHGLVNI